MSCRLKTPSTDLPSRCYYCIRANSSFFVVLCCFHVFFLAVCRLHFNEEVRVKCKTKKNEQHYANTLPYTCKPLILSLHAGPTLGQLAYLTSLISHLSGGTHNTPSDSTDLSSKLSTLLLNRLWQCIPIVVFLPRTLSSSLLNVGKLVKW